MSRSGYSDDLDTWALVRWRGAVNSAIKGKRGQEFLKEMLRSLDALPTHSLIAEELEENEEVCALGAIGKARGMDMAQIDPEDRDNVAKSFGIPLALACEIMYENDEWFAETPEKRWQRMRNWTISQIRQRDLG